VPDATARACAALQDAVLAADPHAAPQISVEVLREHLRVEHVALHQIGVRVGLSRSPVLRVVAASLSGPLPSCQTHVATDTCHMLQ